MNNGPVIIVDNDEEDWEIIQDAWADLRDNNELIFMSKGSDVMDYMESDNKIPFLILCDVNLNGMSGFDLKEKLYNSSSNYASIPFIFWSSAVSHAQIERAYDLGANGFFLKENTLAEIKQTLIDIIRYWKKCVVPL
jgi:CheY-like chemotaxis protein